jgi:HEAT repeat protein
LENGCFSPGDGHSAGMPMRRIWVAVLLIIITIGIALFVGPRSEPSYHGRPLNAWLKDLDDQHPGLKNDAAVEAVRHIGRDSVPEIIRLLESRDSSLKQRFLKWLNDYQLVKSVYTPVLENHHRAVLACNVIGPNARLAIPALIALLNDGYARGYVGAALGRIGPEAVVPLIGSLTNSDSLVRMEVVNSLVHFRSNSPIVVPVLIKCLQDGSPPVRGLAAHSLGMIGQEPEIAIPALVAMLDNEKDQQAHWNACLACLAIGQFKRQAQSARTPLFAALQDSDPSVRATAAIALARIEPDNGSTVDKVMPFLIEDLTGLQGSNVKYPLNFQYPAIEALGECGSHARPAVPALLECLKTAQPYVREAAAKSLKAIDPEAAIKAGLN